MAELTISGLNQYYGSAHTLRDVSLTVPDGRCLVLMGRNGVGKTTLLQSIMGHLPLASGQVALGEQALDGQSPETRARAGLGYVPQGRQIFPMLSVEENLRVGLRAREDGAKEIPELVFELFPVLHEMRHRRGGDLSGGQQQQLAIGRALATDPSCLLLDEPTDGIQPNIVAMISDIIRRLSDQHGMTVLLVEQKLAFARSTGDVFTILDRGTIMASGAMEALDEQTVSAYLTV